MTMKATFSKPAGSTGEFVFKQPDLSAFDADGPQLEYANRFTRIRAVAVSDTPDAHTVWFVVGSQYFRIDTYCDTAAEANWHCWMLAKAVQQLMSDIADGPEDSDDEDDDTDFDDEDFDQ